MAYSDIARDTVLILGIIDLFVSVGYVVFVLVELRDCCVWVLVLPTLHLWIWIFALCCANVRLDAAGFAYAFVGILSVSFVIDIIVAVVELIIFKTDMKWQIIVLFAFQLVLGLLSLSQAITATTLANAIYKEIEIYERSGVYATSNSSRPIRGLVAVWISFDVFWLIFFWIIAALTLRSCCWWIILFATPHFWIWVFALGSANSRIENPWLFYLYAAVAGSAAVLDLSALAVSTAWFNSTHEPIYVIWAVFFGIFLILDVGNLLFSTNQIFAIVDEEKDLLHRRYSDLNKAAAASDKKNM